jgi:hypothetical protein
LPIKSRRAMRVGVARLSVASSLILAARNNAVGWGLILNKSLKVSAWRSLFG